MAAAIGVAAATLCDYDKKASFCASSTIVPEVTKEPSTGIPFPAVCNEMSLAGVGVRIKYVFVKVYAVGAYFDPVGLGKAKHGGKEAIERALLNPSHHPRTIRIVMNRDLTGK